VERTGIPLGAHVATDRVGDDECDRPSLITDNLTTFMSIHHVLTFHL
jgi:hypothetical protein